MERQKRDELVLTVGSNPVPVVVAALALKPRVVHLVYTTDVAELVGRIQLLLQDRGVAVDQGHLVEIKNQDEPPRIREELEGFKDVFVESDLHFSGGTKLLVVNTHAFWSSVNSGNETASYLSPDGCLRFDNGSSQFLDEEPKLSLNELCKLHFGCEPTCEDSHLDKDKLSKSLEIFNTLRSDSIEDAKDKAKDIDWGKDNKWLEVALANNLSKSGRFHEVRQSVALCRPGTSDQEFESDVVAIRGYRPYLFSCTIADKIKKTKLKLFEAIHNARRIGGDHARVALYCMYEKPGYIAALVRPGGWAGYGFVRVFGAPHIRGNSEPCWVEADGNEGAPMEFDEAIEQWVGPELREG